MSNTKAMVALTFADDSHRAQLVRSFRSRFDYQYQKNLPLFMSLIPPFEAEKTHLFEFIETLKEEMETFFYGGLENQSIQFNNLDFHYANKHKLLYLRPHFDDNWSQLVELVEDIARPMADFKDKKVPDSLPFLSIGRFQNDLSCQLAVDVARQEFQLPISFAVENLVLMEKKNHVWQTQAQLYEFESSHNRAAEFLQSNNTAL